MTDEDKMIYTLKVHRDLIGWVIKKLKEEGILAERTTGNNSKGDILIVKREDAPRVQEIVRDLQIKYKK